MCIKVVSTHDDVVCMEHGRLYVVIDPCSNRVVVCEYIASTYDYWLKPIQQESSGLRKGTLHELAYNVSSKAFRIFEDN